MADTGSDVQDAGEDAYDSIWVDRGARVGLVAYGVVHLLVGWLALQLALGERSASASSAGALHELAQQPLGSALVWAVAVGMLLLVVWRLLEAGFGHREEHDDTTRWRKRAASLLKAVVYGALGWSAVMVAVGEGSRGGRSSTTARLMDLPAGQWLVGAAGLVVAGYGLNLVRRGWTEKFAEHLEPQARTGRSGTAYVLLGKAGHFAKGAAIVLVGGLTVYAAVRHRPKESGGLDKALQTLLEQPFGQVALIAIAVGIGCYGLFCFARARYLNR
ncbi:DUF1206 domain-containing protein [Nocardioides gansuensis]|uniref:DUF1206 domain-containing protein n=1 Tax=Nocardioides gansuensis TaxID=2138300 RepID=A0A2T8FAZ9_9ACTN|nr:DUF1206 domain-containing protein [Nocardioides gansuensis]PVG82896.1 DUF1206 domain-containing protein [Nocardioides gansuensis]